MKYLLRCFFIYAFSLWLTSQIVPGIIIRDELPGLLISAGVLSLLMIIVKPILKILFIPINFMTFGLLSWGVNIIVIYILTFLVPGVIIRPWVFPGHSQAGFVIPGTQVSYTMSLIIVTIAITLLASIFEHISEQ